MFDLKTRWPNWTRTVENETREGCLALLQIYESEESFLSTSFSQSGKQNVTTVE